MTEKKSTLLHIINFTEPVNFTGQPWSITPAYKINGQSVANVKAIQTSPTTIELHKTDDDADCTSNSDFFLQPKFE